MATPTFISDCGDSTGNLVEWSAIFLQGVTLAIDAVTFAWGAGYGTHGVRCSTGSSASAGYFSKTGILNDAGRRFSFNFEFTGTLATKVDLFTVITSIGTGLFSLALNPDGTLSLSGAGVLATGATVLSASQVVRISCAYMMTSTTVNTITVFVNGISEFSVSNTTFASIGSVDLYFGPRSNSSANVFLYYRDVFVDNGTDLADPGNIRVTRKAPSALGAANSFDTLIGSTTNRWDYVDEVPIALTKGLQQAGSSQVSENFGVQSASAGDVDISAGTIVGRSAWAYAKRGYVAGEILASGAPVPIGGGTSTSTSLSSSAVLPVGTTVVVAVGFDDNLSVTSVTDTYGNTYTPITASSLGGSSSPRLQFWYSTITADWTGPTTFININHASSALKGAGSFVAFAGIGTPTTNDALINQNGSGTSQSGASTGTLSQANEIVIGCFIQNTATAYSGAPTGYTSLGQGGSSGGSGATNIQMSWGYKFVNATTSQSCSITGANTLWASSLISFRLNFDPTASQAGTPALIHDNVFNSITFTTSSSYFSNTISASAMPAASAAVGLRSTGSAADTYLYECGIMIAYIPGTTGPTFPSGIGGNPFGALGFSQMAQLLAQ